MRWMPNSQKEKLSMIAFYFVKQIWWKLIEYNSFWRLMLKHRGNKSINPKLWWRLATMWMKKSSTRLWLSEVWLKKNNQINISASRYWLEITKQMLSWLLSIRCDQSSKCERKNYFHKEKERFSSRQWHYLYQLTWWVVSNYQNVFVKK